MAELLGPWQYPEGQLSLIRAALAAAPDLLSPPGDPALHSTLLLEDRDVRALPAMAPSTMASIASAPVG
jgi:hypothetical protein